MIGEDFTQRNNICVANNNNLVTNNSVNKSHQIPLPTQPITQLSLEGSTTTSATMNSHGGAAVVVESIPGTGNASGLPPTIAPAALNGGTITAQNMTTTQQGKSIVTISTEFKVALYKYLGTQIYKTYLNSHILYNPTSKGLGPNMVLVNAATGATISASAAPQGSLGGTITTQSTNSASLPAGISVQQLLQQAQQQQAQQQAQAQQQVLIIVNFAG